MPVPDRVLRNSSVRAGDLPVLGKPQGIGFYSAALKKGVLGEEGDRRMIGSTTRLNTPGGGPRRLSGGRRRRAKS